MIESPQIKFPSFTGKERVGQSGFAGIKKFKPASPKINFQQDQPQPGAQAGTLAGSMTPGAGKNSFNPLKIGKMFQ